MSFITGNTAPPHSDEVEKAVLGAALRGNVKHLDSMLKPEYFYSEKNQELAETLISLSSENIQIDIASVCEDLQARGKAEIATPFYVMGVETSSVTTANYGRHVLILKEYYLRRRTIESARKMELSARDQTTDILETVGMWETEACNLTRDIVVKEYKKLDDLIEVEIKELMRINELFNDGVVSGSTGLETMLLSLDNIIAGYEPGLHLIAGRPGQGKTAVALYFAREFARAGSSVGFFSVEMSSKDLVKRILISESGIDAYKVKTGQIDNDTLQKIVKIAGKTSEMKIVIDDTSSITLPEIKAKARTMVSKHGVKSIFVDYVGLIRQTERLDRHLHIGKISNELKNLSGELDIPIFLLSQVNRDCVKRPDKMPEMSDLRESGSLEQDADTITFIVRPEFYDIDTYEDGESTAGTAILKIDKNRSGKTGEAIVGCRIDKYEFYNVIKNDFPDEIF